ncbi:MAG TPA: hypothetical protein VH062_06445, partial [Polyangiaceae bacterium]|nr:hypothetical protein [Polyangiaceae bacterium]
MGMKTWFLASLLTFTAVATAACGGDSKPPPLPADTTGSSTGGRHGVGGGSNVDQDSGADAGSSLDGGDASTVSGGDGGVLSPIVTVTSPVQVTDPNVGPVISSVNGANMVRATCTAIPGTGASAKPIDASMVVLEMLDATGVSLTASPGIQSQAKPSEFSADFIFTNVKNGKVFFRCTAHDKGGLTGTNTISSFVDNGPAITALSPVADSAHPYSPLSVEFTATALALAKGDTGAPVDTVALQINGKNIDLTGDGDASGHYKLSVNIADQTLFPTKLNGAIAIVITATDKRGVQRTSTYHFVVDSAGPVIAITAPLADEIIGGNRLLEFTVKDDGSGVNRDSVVVTVNQDTHSFDLKGLWSENMGAYTFSLDSANITGATVQINVNITANDLAGNPSAGTSATYYLDTMPPTVDLDPPQLQEMKSSNGGNVCSQLFDPLGDTANDFDPSVDPPFTIDQFTTLRAIAWDEENGTPDEPFRRFSGVATDSVKVYVQGNATAGLLIDTNKDGVCDEVDTTLPFLNMYPVPPNGSATYQGVPDTSITTIATKDVPATTLCGAGTENVPDRLCSKTSDLRRVIQHDQLGGPVEDVVYALV